LLNSEDPQCRRDARIRLSQEFHRLIAGIVQHRAQQRSPDRYASVHLKLDADGVQTSYAFSPQTLMAIHFTLPDGRTGMIGPSILHHLPSVMRAADDTDDDMTKAELVRRAIAGTMNVGIRSDGKGNYQAIRVEQLAAV
jgi:hypothetical protein